MISYKSPQDHLCTLLANTDKAVRLKYHAGQKEHGGQLWRKPVMDFIGEEIHDLIVYWRTHEEQWQDVMLLVYAALHHRYCAPQVKDILQMALNIMTIGNREGEEEEELNDG